MATNHRNRQERETPESASGTGVLNPLSGLQNKSEGDNNGDSLALPPCARQVGRRRTGVSECQYLDLSRFHPCVLTTKFGRERIAFHREGAKFAKSPLRVLPVFAVNPILSHKSERTGDTADCLGFSDWPGTYLTPLFY